MKIHTICKLNTFVMPSSGTTKKKILEASEGISRPVSENTSLQFLLSFSLSITIDFCVHKISLLTVGINKCYINKICNHISIK